MIKYLEVEYKGEKISGQLIKEDSEFMTLKLKSGYNSNLSKKNVKIISEKSIPEKTGEKQEIKFDKSLPKVSILHTGGTIASKVDYKTGAVSSKFTPEELLALYPELREIANVEARLIGNMWSQDMRFPHYNLMAKEVEKEVNNGAKGVIITQGTDTLHYSSAALSFILEGIKVPVIFVGSQRSSDRPSSDASLNLLSAIYYMENSSFKGVGVCMHDSESDTVCSIIEGTRARKFHTSRRDAFKSINSKPIALVDYKNKKIEELREPFVSSEKFKLKLIKENIKVAILKQYPNMFAEDFNHFKDFDGLVIESTGLGNLPISENDELTKESKKIESVLKNLIKSGLIITLSAQTIFGRLNLNVYENAIRQQKMGILGNDSDMTTETTFIKLAWLLSNFSKEESKELLSKNLRGELSKRTEEELLL